MLSIFKPSPFFTQSQERLIMAAIRKAETGTTGEVRLYIESRCKGAIQERTIAVFKRLKIYRTTDRNGVLLYIAMKDKKFAIFGDEGIHKEMGHNFWANEATTLKTYFEKDQILEGICQVIEEIGGVLKAHYPHASDDNDHNELPDTPVYGR